MDESTNVQNIKALIHKVLQQDTRLWNEDKTELNETLLLDLVEKIDKTVITLLFQHKELKEKFFIHIQDTHVFKTHDFRFFMEEHKVHNSYTAYKNKIGLSDGKHFIKDTHDVVLNFPYKDCVLEGGQRSEDGEDTYFGKDKTGHYQEKKAKRKEIFFNQILAHDEIDRLYDSKALTNWKRYSKDGVQEVETIPRDEEGTIRENMIIKGNNLIALHSLKKQFTRKIKLIYIDPPYNTGNDSFNYNDNFNHSTWLVFMKNRLEAARALLREDGVIFVQCDDNEQAYLKVLMDEVFGRENFIQNIIWKKRSGAPNDKVIGATHENILLYSKNNPKLYRRERSQEQLNRYSNPDNHPKGCWAIDNLMANVKGGRFVKSLYFAIKNPITNEEHYPSSNGNWRFNEKTINKLLTNNEIYFGKNGKGRPKLKRFLSEVQEGVPYSTIWDFVPQGTVGTKEILNIFGTVNKFDTPKPEGLLEHILQIATKPGDIVLDYHLGSGTTCAVAHKMGRQYIGIEQMDYIEPIAVERLSKVIDGEQGGISKAVQWQGGGTFVYCELAQWNEIAKNTILACTSLHALETFFDEMYERYFLNYNLKTKEFKEHVLKEEPFRPLSLDEQKHIFATMLDLNHMYVNYTEMADAKYNIRTEDKKLTEEFYT